MKITVNIGDLVEATGQAAVTTDRLAHMPIGNLYLRASKKEDGRGFAYIFSTNLSSRTLIKIPAEVETEGEILFDPNQMQGGLVGRPRDENVEVSLFDDGKRIRVQYKRSKFHLGFPTGADQMGKWLKEIPFTAKPSFTVKGGDLAEYCRRGMFCIPNDDGSTGTRLGGMYLTDSEDGYAAYATDGAIAAQIRVVAEKGKLGRAMIPLKSLPAINRLLGKRRDEDIDLVVVNDQKGDPVQLYFKSGDVIFGTSLIYGNLENVKLIMGQTKPKFTFDINRQELKSALERASNFSDTRSRTLRMEVRKDALILKTNSSINENDDIIDIEQRGEFPAPIKLAINLDYLSNIAGGSHGEKLEIGLSGPLEAVMVNDDSDERVKSKYVLMPVRV